MKRLITAAIVRQELQAGKKRLEVILPDCIVTPEARTVAQQLGLELVESVGGPAACPCAQTAACTPPPAKDLTNGDLAAIRAAIMAQLPEGSVPQDVIDQLVKKAAQQAADAPDIGSFRSETTARGIKTIDGRSVKLGIFEGAGRENRVGIVDAVTPEDGSSMAAGFMSWENCFFPWTLTYDEVDYIIDGELHIRCDGVTSVAKAGDIIFIPKNTAIEFGTPTRVTFFYVAYPGNWQEI